MLRREADVDGTIFTITITKFSNLIGYINCPDFSLNRTV